MNKRSQEVFSALVDHLRKSATEEDHPKLKELERMMRETCCERKVLLTKIGDLESQRAARKAEAIEADSALQKQVNSWQQRYDQTKSAMQAQIAERDDTIRGLLERTGELVPTLYRIDTGAIFMTKRQLIRANRESIRLGFNRNLDEDYLASLPKQRYFATEAYYHIGFSGRQFQQLNYRLALLLCRRKACPDLRPTDMDHGLLDVSAEIWDELRTQEVPMPESMVGAH